MPEININDLAKELDGEDMIGFTRSFVRDIRSGLEEISSARYDWIDTLAKQDWSGVLALGMGGSAAGGDFLASLCSLQGKIPVVVQRDYVIPSWWNKSWLILATSHSGNTEEAIDATEIALKSGAVAVGALSAAAVTQGRCRAAGPGAARSYVRRGRSAAAAAASSFSFIRSRVFARGKCCLV